MSQYAPLVDGFRPLAIRAERGRPALDTSRLRPWPGFSAPAPAAARVRNSVNSVVSIPFNF